MERVLDEILMTESSSFEHRCMHESRRITERRTKRDSLRRSQSESAEKITLVMDNESDGHHTPGFR